MKLKKIIILIIVLVAALYYATPYIAVYSLKNAADKKDLQKVEKYIDFDSLKADFKTKMRTIISNGLEYRAKENTDQSDAIGALGQVIANALIDPLVNSLVTPEIISAIIRGEKPENGLNDIKTTPDAQSEQIINKEGQPVATAPAAASTAPVVAEEKKKRNVKIIPGYSGVNHFHIKVTDLNDKDSEVTFVMRREGLIGWKIYQAEIPALDKIANTINKKLSDLNNANKANTPEFQPTTPSTTPSVAPTNAAPLNDPSLAPVAPSAVGE